MKKLVYIVMFVALSLFIKTSTTSAGEASSEKPSFSVGDYWVYKNQNSETIRLEFIGMENGKYVHIRNGEKVLYNEHLTDSKSQDVSFPLFIGKTWEFETGNSQSSKCTVEAFEEVETPAGRFPAFKIRQKTVAGIMENYARESTYWYAPGVGRIVKSPRAVLIEYKRNKS